MKTYKSRTYLVKIICLGVLFAIALCSCNKADKAKYNPKDLIILKDSVTNLYYYADTNFRRVGELYTKAYAFQDKHAIVCLDTSYYVIDEEFRIVRTLPKIGNIYLWKDLLWYNLKNGYRACINFNTDQFKLVYNTKILPWKNDFLFFSNTKDSNDKNNLILNVNNKDVTLINRFRIYDKCNFNLYYLDNEIVYSDYIYAFKNNKQFLIDSIGNMVQTPEANYIFPVRNGYRIYINNNKLGAMTSDFKPLIKAEFDQIGDLDLKTSREYFNPENILDYSDIYERVLFYGQDLEAPKSNFVYLKKANKNYLYGLKSKRLIESEYTIEVADYSQYMLGKKNNKYYLLDTNAKVVINESWDKAYFIADKILETQNKGHDRQCTYYNLEQRIPTKLCKGLVFHFNDCGEGLIICKESGEGVCDRFGKMIIPCNKKNIFYSENTKSYFVTENNKTYLFSKYGKKIKEINYGIKYINENKSYLYSHKYGKIDVFDNNLNKVLSVPCDDLKFMRANIIEVTFKGKSRYYKL